MGTSTALGPLLSLPRVGGSQGFSLEQLCRPVGPGTRGEAVWRSAESKVLKEAVGNSGLGLASAERVGRSSMGGVEGRSALPSPTCGNKVLISSQHDIVISLGFGPSSAIHAARTERGCTTRWLEVWAKGCSPSLTTTTTTHSLYNQGQVAFSLCLSFLVCKMEILIGPT